MSSDDNQISWTIEGGSGRSIDDAVIITGAANGMVGVWLEQAYIASRHSKYKDLSQSLIAGADGGVYDLIVIEQASGEKVSYYFDISQFYGT